MTKESHPGPYFEIVNWKKAQPRMRGPGQAWVKLYTSLLDNEDFKSLDKDSRLLLVYLWLYAGRSGRYRFPNDPVWLFRRLLPLDAPPNLGPLAAPRSSNGLGWIRFCDAGGNDWPPPKPKAAPKAKARTGAAASNPKKTKAGGGRKSRPEKREQSREEKRRPEKTRGEESRAEENISDGSNPSIQKEASEPSREDQTRPDQRDHNAGSRRNRNVRISPPRPISVLPTASDGFPGGPRATVMPPRPSAQRRGYPRLLADSFGPLHLARQSPEVWDWVKAVFEALAHKFDIDSPLGRQECGAYAGAYEKLATSGIPPPIQGEILEHDLRDAVRIGRKTGRINKGAVFLSVHKQRVQHHLARFRVPVYNNGGR